MKATDLMIGDWVNVVVQWKPEIKYMYGEVSELLALDGCLKVRQSYDPYHDNEIYCICDTEPIPLTPEILEKNYGKETRVGISDKPCWGEMGAIWSTMLWKCENSFWLEVSTIAGGFVKKHVRYVHELQHALRLCGIEKEIVL